MKWSVSTITLLLSSCVAPSDLPPIEPEWDTTLLGLASTGKACSDALATAERELEDMEYPGISGDYISRMEFIMEAEGATVLRKLQERQAMAISYSDNEEIRNATAAIAMQGLLQVPLTLTITQLESTKETAHAAIVIRLQEMGALPNPLPRWPAETCYSPLIYDIWKETASSDSLGT